MDVITGEYSEQDWFGRVTFNGRELTPERSQRFVNHSPDGFAWGYYGSGPCQLAFAILLEVLPNSGIVEDLYLAFCKDVIAPIPRGPFTLTLDVERWASVAGKHVRQKSSGSLRSMTERTADLMMTIKVTPAVDTSKGKLADAELIFTAGPLAGLKFVGFTLWKSRHGDSINITFPDRRYTFQGETKSFAYVRTANDPDAERRLRQAILAEWEKVKP